ncbi:MAG TPA: zinc-binding dehydrogenase [Polyangia bacterium]|nr:zinc-binding dehydrogenase [Polyangia bacterium]
MRSDEAERLGIHRVIEPAGALPQAAVRLDAQTQDILPGELCIDVDVLNVDSASFRQLEETCGGDPAAIGLRVADIVAGRGKLHNPVTGSGGMLLGRVSKKSGPRALARFQVAPGDRVSTLVSLTLTPLRIEQVVRVVKPAHQIEIVGEAVLFESGMLARMPVDLPERVALAALDVAGAAPQVARLVEQRSREGGPAARVLVLGCGGKSGLLASAAARRAGASVVGIEGHAAAAAIAERLGACERVQVADARDPVAVLEAAGAGFDLVVSCVNVEGAEMAAILTVRDGGTVYFFSMATSFTRAALGAEGVSRDAAMLIGNGYFPGHAEATLALLRADARLRAIFEERYG